MHLFDNAFILHKYLKMHKLQTFKVNCYSYKAYLKVKWFHWWFCYNGRIRLGGLDSKFWLRTFLVNDHPVINRCATQLLKYRHTSLSNKCTTSKLLLQNTITVISIVW